MNTEDLHRNIIQFGEWILNSPYTQGWNIKSFWWNQNTEETYTTEQLFQIYLNESNEKNSRPN